MSNAVEMSWTNLRGGTTTREVSMVADARNLKGTAGYAWIVMAANPGLSSADIERFLAFEGNGAERSLSWIKRRRWMFPPRTAKRRQGQEPDIDGKQGRAVEIMRANPRLSARSMTHLLKQHGIKRGKDWVRKHRCDGQLAT